jgi:hypothetical protein
VYIPHIFPIPFEMFMGDYGSRVVFSTKIYPAGENGEPRAAAKFYQVGHAKKIAIDGREVQETGSLGPIEYLRTLEDAEITRFAQKAFKFGDDKVTVFYQIVTSGREIMHPGLYYQLKKGATLRTRLDFISPMLALFLGTSGHHFDTLGLHYINICLSDHSQQEGCKHSLLGLA